MVCLSKLGVAYEEKVPHRVVWQISTRYDHNCNWSVSSSSLQLSNYIKPGGTATLSMQQYTGCIIEYGSDQ